MSIEKIGLGLKSLGKFSNFIPKNTLPRYSNFKSFRDINSVNNHIFDYLVNPPNIYSTVNQGRVKNNKFKIYSPLFKNKEIGYCYSTTENEIIDSISNYKKRQSMNGLETNLNILYKASNLIENKYYDKLLASIIVNQGKNLIEAELDATELIDFLRFNIYYTVELYKKQPNNNLEENIINCTEYIPLDGFVSSITPFNFSAIAGNLASLPLVFNNFVSWKPSPNSYLSNKLIYDILIEAGVSQNNLDFVIYDGKKYFDIISKSSDMAGILFTGSSNVFSNIFKKVGNNIDNYKNYPRLVGETGGKNFHFIDYNCNIDEAIDMTFESAFNYSGQKCSACSRLYLPLEYVNVLLKKFKNFNYEMTSSEYGLISKDSFEKTISKLDDIRNEHSVRTFGGNTNNYNSYYFEPTLIIDEKHSNNIFNEEFFAPILAVYPYKTVMDGIQNCKKQDTYALTGSIFSNNLRTITDIKDSLSNTCGNLYINQKSTGAVVGQQPFGGFRKSGTNDKAGDINLLYRVCNQKNIKLKLN